MKMMITTLLAVFAAGGINVSAVVYEEDFSSVTTTQVTSAVNFGGTSSVLNWNDWTLSGVNAGLVDQGGGDFAVRPNADTKNNGRLSMVVIDCSTWDPGTYTLSFDFIGADTGGSRLYVGEGYGYDLTGSVNDAIQVDGFADGFSDPLEYGINPIGNATVADLIDINLDGVGGANETVSRTISTNFTISANATAVVLGFGSYNSSFLVDNVRIEAVPSSGPGNFELTLYAEYFSGTVGEDYFGGVGNFAYGYDPGDNYKALSYSQWGSLAASTSFPGGVGVPNPTQAASGRLIGTFLDPALFAGYEGETLTLHFDIIADSTGDEQNARAFIYEASGYGTGGGNDWHLAVGSINLTSGDPMDNILIGGTTGTATIARLIRSDDLVTATGTTDYTIDFTYTAGTGIGLAFGALGSDVAFDNVSISVNTVPPDPLPAPEILPPLTPAWNPLPNIVLFLADDMGIGDTSAYQDLTGNPDEKQIYTPNMERLAERGTRYTDAHTPGSTCTPSRLGLLSGSYPFRSALKMKAANQTHTEGLMFPGRRHTMADMLKRSGYRTYGYGKWHLGHQSDKYGSGLMIEGPLESGFDTYTGSDGNFGYPGAMIKDNQFMRFDADDNLVPYHDPSALPWIEGGGVWTGFKDPNLLKVQPAVFAALESDLATHMSSHANRPLFIYYASHGNHDPYVAAPEIAGQVISSNVTVSGTIINVPLDPGGDLDGDGIPDPDFSDPDYVWGESVVDKWWDPHFETNALGEVIFNGPTARARMVVENDIIVGELLDFLSETDDPRNPGYKMIDNTLFIFTSDNGADMKARYAVGKLPQDDGAGLVQLNGFKGTVSEGGTRVPFIASLPGLIATNETSSAIFGLNDLYATIAEMIGHRLEEDEAVDSESLLTAWTNGLDGIVRSQDLIYQHLQLLLSRRGEFKLHARDGDFTGDANDRFADSNNLDFDDMVFNKFYNLSNDLNEASNLGNTATASDMLAVMNTLGGQGYSRTGAVEQVNGVNFMGGSFFSGENWRSYVNVYDFKVPLSPVPGIIATNATVAADLTGMKLIHRAGTVDFMPPGTGTLANAYYEVRGGLLSATNGPVALVDTQLRVADGTADFGTEVLGMNASDGTIISMGGTLTAGALSIGDQPGTTPGAKTVRFEKGSGSILLSDIDPIRFGDDGDTGNDFINFTTGTKGRLVSVQGSAFYESLWNSGQLRIDGQTGTVSFAASGFLLLDQGDGTEALVLDAGQVVDYDNDGIDDIWEQEQVGSTDLLPDTIDGDYDDDGLPDVVEYILDYDPEVFSGDFLTSGHWNATNMNFIVSFDSSSSRTYVLEYKNDLLSAGDWEVRSVDPGVDGVSAISQPATDTNGFFRVQVFAP